MASSYFPCCRSVRGFSNSGLSGLEDDLADSLGAGRGASTELGAWLGCADCANDAETLQSASIPARSALIRVSFSIQESRELRKRLEHKKRGAREGLPVSLLGVRAVRK